MLKPDWAQHGRGEASIGAISFMLADLHARVLVLEGKQAEAVVYESQREASEARMAAPRKSILHRWFKAKEAAK